MRNFLEWALWAVQATPFYVFPLKPNGKIPITSAYDATRDPEKIKAWWSASPDCNIGYAYFMSGHSIVDLDVKDLVKNGVDTWEGFIAEHGPAPTFSIRTMSGGYHFVYEDPDAYLPPKNGVWPGIDCKSVGGYGVGIGSHVIDEKRGLEGDYEIAEDLPIAPLPEWLKRLAGGKTQAERSEWKHKGVPAADDQWDSPTAIEEGKAAIGAELARQGCPPRDGDSSDQRTWEICAKLIDYALSERAAVDLLKELWAPHFDRDWMATKYGHAMRYRSSAAGSDRPQSMSERAAAMGEGEQQAQANFTAKLREKYPFRSPADDADLPEIEYWDPHKTLPKLMGGCALIAYGPMSSHKTGVVLKYCLDAVEKGARVLYLAPEGAHGIRKARLPVAMADRGGLGALTGKWYTFSTTPSLGLEGEIDELIGACEAHEFAPDLVVIDTLTRAARGLDISAPQTGVQLVTGMERLAAKWNATVIAVTHPGKDSNRGAIGSSLVESLAYAVWKITFDKQLDAVTLWVEKMKDGPADFGVEFDVTKNAVPVVVGGTRTDHKPAHRAGRKQEGNRWDWIVPQVREQLSLLKPRETTDATTLAGRIKGVQGAEESLDSWFTRQDNFRKALMRAAKNGPLAAYVERVGDDPTEEKAGYVWRLPSK